MRLFTAQLVTVLEYLQGQQIMHRDLKPQNIMLDENYYIKVVSVIATNLGLRLSYRSVLPPLS